MISLSDEQLQTVMVAAGSIDPNRRTIFLERAGAMLKMRGRFSDDDVAEIARLALCGLIHSAADTAA
jgi:hypothetical protein